MMRAAGLAAAGIALAATAAIASPPSQGVANPTEVQAVQAPRNLADLVFDHQGAQITDAEQECLAGAVYFEARSEPLEGQLAVAEVVLNRTVSGRYPTTICKVVTQKAQFSFIRNGRFPRADRDSQAWRNAVAVAHIARNQLADTLSSNVLWYHATYVSPSWGRRLTRTTQIGLHIFYS
jgi:spore germination cell wall hydrolase CwlJ-like protein